MQAVKQVNKSELAFYSAQVGCALTAIVNLISVMVG